LKKVSSIESLKRLLLRFSTQERKILFQRPTCPAEEGRKKGGEGRGGRGLMVSCLFSAVLRSLGEFKPLRLSRTQGEEEGRNPEDGHALKPMIFSQGE